MNSDSYYEMKYYKYKAKLAKLKGGTCSYDYSPIMTFDNNKFLDRYPALRSHYNIKYIIYDNIPHWVFLQPSKIFELIGNNEYINECNYDEIKTYRLGRFNFELKTETSVENKNEILTTYNHYISSEK